MIFAGVLHAVWNAVAKAASDRYAGFALIGIAQAGAGLLMVCLAGQPARASWPWIGASVVLHVVYGSPIPPTEQGPSRAERGRAKRTDRRVAE